MFVELETGQSIPSIVTVTVDEAPKPVPVIWILSPPMLGPKFGVIVLTTAVIEWVYVIALVISLFPALITTSHDLSTPAVTATVLYLIPNTFSYASWHADKVLWLNLTYRYFIDDPVLLQVFHPECTSAVSRVNMVV